MSNADLRRRGPAPIYGSSEVGEVSTDLVSRDGHESISLVMPDEVARVGGSLVSTVRTACHQGTIRSHKADCARGRTRC